MMNKPIRGRLSSGIRLRKKKLPREKKACPVVVTEKEERRNAAGLNKLLSVPEKFFCCPKCCKYFKQEEYQEFVTHLTKECSTKKGHACRICSKLYSSTTALNLHVSSMHKSATPPPPTEKEEETTPVEEITESSSEKRPYYCGDYFPKLVMVDFGNYVTTTESKAPAASSDSDDELTNENDDGVEDSKSKAERIAKVSGIWKCWVCFYESGQKSLWQTHLNRVHPEVIGNPISCNFCPFFIFSKKHHLREHLHEVHYEKCTFKCKVCGRAFLYKKSDHNCCKIVCKFCDKTFNTLGGKSKHMLSHEEYRPFKCTDCSKTFQKKVYLRVHSRIHKDVRDYHCSSCDKKFRSKSQLNTHERIHSGQKPYICHNCGRSFTSFQSLDGHLKTHDDDPPTNKSCNECGTTFRSTSDFNKHRKIHTEEKTFECPTCGKFFRRRGHLTRHHQQVHSNKATDLTCKVCNTRFKRWDSLEEHWVRVHFNVVFSEHSLILNGSGGD